MRPAEQSLIARFEGAAIWWRNRLAARRTRRIVADLPRHIQKDIGWPEGAGDRPGRNLWML